MTLLNLTQFVTSMDRFVGLQPITALEARALAIKSAHAEFAADLAMYAKPDPITGCRVPANASKGAPFGRFTRNSDGIQFRCRGAAAEVKVLAHRMVFAETMDTARLIADTSVSVSHLCHNDNCCEKSHLVLGESLDYNKSRNTCPANDGCWHFPRCVFAGKQYVPTSLTPIFWFQDGALRSSVVQHRGANKDGL
jgi:hypothetical protein